MDFQLLKASPADAVTLQNLLQLYTHDFSEFWAGTDKGELGPDGRFAADPLDAYWERPNWRAWLFQADGAPAGFALVNDETHSSRPADHSVAEFFVVRKHRGGGLGRLAAQRLFAGAAGQWEVAVARKNLPALAFWRRVISGCPAADDIAELDLRGPDWDGPVIRFRTS